MKIIKKDVGKRINVLRTQNNLTMDELAKIAKVGGRSTVNGWEKGRSIPPKKQLAKIANYFNVSIYFILYGSLKEYVFELLSKDIWENEELYGQLTKIIWEYTESTTDINQMLNGIYYDDNGKFIPVGSKMDLKIKEQTKQGAIDESINSVIDEIMNNLNENKISYNDVKDIISISTDIFFKHDYESFNTFKAECNRFKDTLDSLDISTIDIKQNESIDDFLKRKNLKDKSGYTNNHEYNIRDRIDEYFKEKLFKLAVDNFYAKLKKLESEYNMALNDYLN